MLLPLVNPEQQYCDANGVPMAGGTIATYIPGTDTQKPTWVDAEQTALNENPIVLDAAGRCLMYGAGDFRLVLKDAFGNLIWDQETSAIDKSTLVTMTEVNTAVQAETDRAQAAEDTLQTNINTVQSDLAAEIARAEAAETHISYNQLGNGTFQSATGITNSSGYASVTFPVAYGSVTTTASAPGVWVQAISPTSAPSDVMFTVTTSLSGFTVWAGDNTGAGVLIGFMWLAFGTV